MGLSRNNIGISVVIPCYNSQDTIAETLRCIISQMYSGMEIIVVDDGSKDRTGQIVSSYSEKVKYVYQENRGVSEARNRGAALAEKEWIAFCDSDDVWYNDKIRICREVIRSCKDSNFISDIVPVDEKLFRDHTWNFTETQRNSTR
jgi:glycosyltransferase involved in cell wall biosynthesis